MRKIKLTPARLVTVIGVGIFLLVLFLLYQEFKGFRFRDAWDSLHAISTDRVLLAIGLTAVDYILLTCYDLAALHYLRRPLRWWQAAAGAGCGFAVGNSVGHNLLAGAGVRYRLYSRWGLQASEVLQVTIFASLTYWLGYVGLGSGVYLLVHPAAEASSSLASLPFWPLGIGSVALLGAWLMLNTFRRRPFIIRSIRVPLPGLALGTMQILIGTADLFVIASILSVLLPAQLPFEQILLAMLLGHVIGMASQVPGGLGVFEAVMVFTLNPYAPVAELVGGLLAFRLIYYFLPLALAGITLALLEARNRF